MDIAVDHAVDFDAPAEKLWACFTDFGNWDSWVGAGQRPFSFRWEDGQEPAPGKRIMVESEGISLHAMTAREWSPPYLLRLTSEPGEARLHFDMTLTLRPVSQQSTAVDMRLELRALQELPKLPFLAALRFPIEKLARRKIDSVIRQVKETVRAGLA